MLFWVGVHINLGGKRVVTLAKYKFLYAVLFAFLLIFSSLFWTGVPTRGYHEFNKFTPEFTFAYLSGHHGEISIKDWMDQVKDTMVFASPDRLNQDKSSVPPVTSYYPVFDNATNIKQFSLKYSYLPNNGPDEFGKSVYTFDYANARFFFLNAANITGSEKTQIDWLKKNVTENKKIHNIVLLSQDPTLAEFWDTMRDIGVNLVVIQDEIYASDSFVGQSPSDYTSSPYKGWGFWKPSRQFSTPHFLAVKGIDKEMFVNAQDLKGNILDQLHIDNSKIILSDHGDEKVLVGIQSLWKFQHGGEHVKQVVPEMIDITGEQPQIGSLRLPPEDWRSAKYNDSGWDMGHAPLGHSRDKEKQALLDTWLPKMDSSPAWYFRKTFTFDGSAKDIRNLFLHMMYKDAYVVYLNGEEISRGGIRQGLLLHTSLAQPNNVILYRKVPVNQHIKLLANGTNTLAVEIHRSHPKAPDLIFDLSLSYVK
jgi:hypothetical protein